MSTRPGLARGGRRIRETIALIVARDGNNCRRCGLPVDLTLSGLNRLGPTIGHIIAAALGGTDALANLGLEHRMCNLAAGARRDPPRALIAKPIPLA